MVLVYLAGLCVTMSVARCGAGTAVRSFETRRGVVIGHVIAPGGRAAGGVMSWSSTRWSWCMIARMAAQFGFCGADGAVVRGHVGKAG